VFAEDTSELLLTGAGFATGAQLLIGGKVIDGANVKSAAVLTATLKANTLGKGTYDVTVINLDGARATLTQALQVAAGGSAKAGCSCGAPGVDSFVLLALGALVTGRRRRQSR
jgi:MYXO-CTERM domain-containing protein